VQKNTTLQNDLLDCPGSGLIIGAANITVDLNGHTIDGTSAPKSGGIKNDKHPNVTIENGTITDFYFSAVNLGKARGSVVRKLTVRKIGASCKQGDICAGIFLFDSPESTITDNVVSNDVHAIQVNGIDVFNSGNTRVEGNRLDRNDGDGVVLFGSPNSRVVGNQLDGNRRNGIHVNNGSDSISVTGNHARDNGSVGIAVGAINDARVLDNTVSGNSEIGLLLFDLRDSLIRRNRATGNYDGIGLYGGQAGVAQFGGKHGARHNQLVRNTATRNKHLGIWVRGDGGKDVANDNLISGNVASGNGRAGGIVVEGSAIGNRLSRNTADGNAGHGIAARRGTSDAGGNRAHGNRRQPQCMGVACS
jgi:parallel beta-helix repeat protein